MDNSGRPANCSIPSGKSVSGCGVRSARAAHTRPKPRGANGTLIGEVGTYLRMAGQEWAGATVSSVTPFDSGSTARSLKTPKLVGCSVM